MFCSVGFKGLDILPSHTCTHAHTYTHDPKYVRLDFSSISQSVCLSVHLSDCPSVLSVLSVLSVYLLSELNDYKMSVMIGMKFSMIPWSVGMGYLLHNYI